ncbi:MAG: hypothetical protein ACI9QA_000056 [Methanobacteriota archaeon]|jgi:hypothetical protein|uniref:Uncharacterized protein n=1 Tax=Halorutilus salinus TaxID=2487751 RepID=A0A9Q4GJ98_9EURY|nr:hypothetical protein [Halorutilus salinus]MCX2819021.1 hypothetical protein [Halorutilus salinus]
MEVENRDWGRANLVDYVPVAGFVYRFYWFLVARRGQKVCDRSDARDWRDAARAEKGRLFVATGFTVSLGVFVALMNGGGIEPAVVPALLVALGTIFVHRVLSLARVF